MKESRREVIDKGKEIFTLTPTQNMTMQKGTPNSWKGTPEPYKSQDVKATSWYN